jgi:hypothetical protein
MGSASLIDLLSPLSDGCFIYQVIETQTNMPGKSEKTHRVLKRKMISTLHIANTETFLSH